MPRLTGLALARFVDRHMRVEGSCYGHCGKATVFRRVDGDERVVSLFHCPGGYVSRFVYYDAVPERAWFLTFLRSRLHPLDLRERDVRAATRHAWEFGEEADPEGGLRPYLFRQLYWTQPRPRGRGDERLYICVGTEDTEGCGALFVQSVGDERPLCPECLSRRRW